MIQTTAQILDSVRIAGPMDAQEPALMRGIELPEDAKPPIHQAEHYRGASEHLTPSFTHAKPKSNGWNCGARVTKAQTSAEDKTAKQIQRVLQTVCEKRGVAEKLVLGDGRKHNITQPRHEFWFELWRQDILSERKISAHFRRDIKTIRLGIRAHIKRVAA